MPHFSSGLRDMAHELRMIERTHRIPNYTESDHIRKKMQIKSLESIPIRPESADDRRLAIRNSWSGAEAENRYQISIENQLLLELIVTTNNNVAQKAKPTRKRIRIDEPFGIGEDLLPHLRWIDRIRNKQVDWELCPV